jgi:hypothetical protein
MINGSKSITSHPDRNMHCIKLFQIWACDQCETKLSKSLGHLNKASYAIEKLDLLKYVVGCLRYFKCQEDSFRFAVFEWYSEQFYDSKAVLLHFGLKQACEY